MMDTWTSSASIGLLAYSLGLLAAFAGYGWMLARILAPAARLGLGVHLALGMGLVIVLGGVLNGLGLATWTPLACVTGVGVAMFLLNLWLDRRTLATTPTAIKSLFPPGRYRAWLLLLLGAMLCMLLVQYIGWSRDMHFNNNDDFLGYALFPEKMLQTGSLGLEPFNARRMYALGGQAFLQALVRVGRPDAMPYGLLDPGMCLPILLALLWGLCRQTQTHPKFLLLPAILLLLAVPPRANVSALYTAAVLYLSLLCLLLHLRQSPYRGWQTAILLAMPIAALAALKNTLLIPCGLVVPAILFAGVPGHKWGRRLSLLAATLAAAAILCLPWMLAMLKSSGTLMFPLLGKGFHGSVYGALLDPNEGRSLEQIARVGCSCLGEWQFQVMLVAAAGAIAATWRTPWRWTVSIFMAASAASFVLLTVLGGGITHRFGFSQMLPALLAAMILMFRATACQRPSGKMTAIAFMLLGAFVAWSRPDAGDMYNTLANNLEEANFSGGLGRNLPSSRQLQSEVPPGAIILARYDEPFVLDFRRNVIYTMDIPGGASFPPGLPLGQGPAALADYLLRHDIRYVLFSYENEANFQRRLYAKRLACDQPWVRSEAARTFEFHDLLAEIAKYGIVADNGRAYVLDLTKAPKPH